MNTITLFFDDTLGLLLGSRHSSPFDSTKLTHGSRIEIDGIES